MGKGKNWDPREVEQMIKLMTKILPQGSKGWERIRTELHKWSKKEEGEDVAPRPLRGLKKVRTPVGGWGLGELLGARSLRFVAQTPVHGWYFFLFSSFPLHSR